MKARFEKKSMIGEGSYGRAYLAIDNVNGERVVIKEFVGKKMSSNAKRLAMEECTLLSKLNNANIVSYLGHFMQDGNLSIVMEHADKGDLTSLISKASTSGKRISEDTVKDIFFQMVKAVAYIHKRNILHRDIKGGNIFLASAPGSEYHRVLLADFGVSKVLSTEHALTETLAGTPYYLSPELCNSEPYGKKSDIWSLGIVLYEMMMLTTPFRGKNLQAVSTRITRGKFAEITGPYSEGIKNLCYALLRNNPEERPSAKEILEFSIFKGYTELYLANSAKNNPVYVSNPASPLTGGSSGSPANTTPSSKSSGSPSSDPMNRTPTETCSVESSPVKITKRQFHRIASPDAEKDHDSSDYEYLNESAIHNMVYRKEVLIRLAHYRRSIEEETNSSRFQAYIQKIAERGNVHLTRDAIEPIVRQILVGEKERVITSMVDYVTCYTSFMCFERN